MTPLGKQMNTCEDFTLVSEKDTNGTKFGFIDAVTVWINKPHVVNRRLCGAKINSISFIDKKNLASKLKDLLEGFDSVTCKNEGTQLSNKDSIVNDNVDQHAFLEVENLQELGKNDAGIVTRKLISKQSKNENDVTEVITVEDKEDTVTATFYTVDSTASYQLSFISGPDNVNKIQLKKLKSPRHEEKDDQFDWMVNTLLPKLCNWSNEKKLKTSVTSLRLIPIEDYSQKYRYLKEKYGKHFVENWPESTDPQKFVYEDIAIASYLLMWDLVSGCILETDAAASECWVLWEKEREKKQLTSLQSFVDLGCGNGLLVHFLSSEGHPGVGLDIRKRKIWEMYGKDTMLKEVTVTPSEENTYPEYDWLIGNHSDELTPWIPVIAARSSYTCRYFVLPCCHFDFDCKFSGKQQGLSNYRTYLNFVKDVGEVCGFIVEEDTLRIPSTKRVCFIGQDRNYSQQDEALIDDKISVYIKTRSKSCESSPLAESTSLLGESSAKYQKLDNGQKWSSKFEPRDQSKERSRNCQHIDQEVKSLIINTVFNKVLESNELEIRHLPDGRTWKKGGTVALGEVVKLFDREILKQLKSECGGLQTLLRNHNSIFNVSGGNVQLRDLTLDEPYSKKSQLSKKDRSQYFKTLPCWFHLNHPDGCPRTTDTCTFAHGDNDRKTYICDKKVVKTLEKSVDG